MKRFWLLSVLICCFFSQGCFNTTPKSPQGLPVFDFTQKYPEREFIVSDIDKEFIPLETTNDVLADQDFSINYVSKKYIVGVNRSRGDILIFGRDGKVITSFNRKGNSGLEYTSLTSLVFDENGQEIFIADDTGTNRCAVYSVDGKFLRQFHFPSNSYITDLYNFDDETLLAYNGIPRAMSMIEQYPELIKHIKEMPEEFHINQKMPYVFLSKKDGSFVSRLDVLLPQRLSDNYKIKINGNDITWSISSRSSILKSGRECIISDRSSDTVFLLTQDKKLTPLFVQSPTVIDKKYVIYINFKADNYLFFYTLPLPPFYDWGGLIEQYIKELPVKSPTNFFMFDLHTGHIFSIEGSEFYCVDLPEKTAVRSITADSLIEDLENGKLHGKLKIIAQNIKEEDNPVVEIIRFK